MNYGIYIILIFSQKKIFNNFTFLMIGRNEERKALGRGILAFKKVYEKYDDIQMVIRTDWGTEKGVKTALYLAKHKELPIIRDQMKDVDQGYLQMVYANEDVLIVPSKAGACEMGSLEAQACGVPVLVTDWTYMNETVVDKKSGFLIPISETCRDPMGYGRMWGNISIDALADKMIWCIENQKEVKSMGIWARQNIINNYNWDKIGETLYKEMGF
jgi:glycosyltransferase involved in cell wall biosynthesis